MFLETTQDTSKCSSLSPPLAKAAVEQITQRRHRVLISFEWGIY